MTTSLQIDIVKEANPTVCAEDIEIALGLGFGEADIVQHEPQAGGEYEGDTFCVFVTQDIDTEALRQRLEKQTGCVAELTELPEP